MVMEMEAIYQKFQLQNPNWLQQRSHESYWTREENKLFERALAMHDRNTSDKWEKVAQLIPGRSVTDVINQYEKLVNDVSNIEAGLVPTPGYLTSSFTLDSGDDRDFDALRKKSARSKSVDHEKKKGLPWTEDEHRSFLRGLIKHGKGDWRSISRNFVVSKTPTQVASHAQKYFLRLNSGLKDKRRPSIHDITTTNLKNAHFPSDDPFVMLPAADKETMQNKVPDWNQHLQSRNTSVMAFESHFSNLFVPSPYHELHVGPYNPMSEVQSARQGIHGLKIFKCEEKSHF